MTPSYNQAQYLEETILSVIGQHYPNLEYIIMDGGSTDNSVEIIKKYDKYLAYWVSEKDGGQSTAINNGFSKSTGNILSWINADDMYLPGTLHTVAKLLDTSKPELTFGNCFHFSEGMPNAWGSNVKKWHATSDVVLYDYLIQPSTFWTRKAWLTTGHLDQTLTFAFDWDWFIRAKKAGVIFKPQNRYLSIYRFHKNHKTSTGGIQRFNEIALMYKRHAGIRYEKLFLQCRHHWERIQFVKKWICRIGLSRFEIPIIKIFFPRIFFNCKEDDIRCIFGML